MLNKMSMLLGATAILALSASAAYAEPGDHGDRGTIQMTDPTEVGYGNGYNYGYDDGYARRDRDNRYRSGAYRPGLPAGIISVDLNGIAFGFRDGYWDNGHRWHRWHHNADYRSYRDRDGSNYRSRNHDRYENDGWTR